MKSDMLIANEVDAFSNITKEPVGSVVSALLLRATHGLHNACSNISEIPFSNTIDNWVGFSIQYGHIWCRLVSYNDLEIGALNASNVLQHISIMEPLLAKLETTLGIHLEPSVIQPADLNSVGLRLHQDELVIDIKLPVTLVMKFDILDDIYTVFDSLDAQINFNIDIAAPALDENEITSLETGDLIAWPESKYQMLAQCTAVDDVGPIRWAMNVSLPELLPICTSGNPSLSWFVRFQRISASTHIIMGHGQAIELPMAERAQLYNGEQFIAWIYIIPFGESFAMLVNSINL